MGSARTAIEQQYFYLGVIADPFCPDVEFAFWGVDGDHLYATRFEARCGVFEIAGCRGLVSGLLIPGLLIGWCGLVAGGDEKGGRGQKQAGQGFYRHVSQIFFRR